MLNRIEQAAETDCTSRLRDCFIVDTNVQWYCSYFWAKLLCEVFYEVIQAKIR